MSVVRVVVHGDDDGRGGGSSDHSGSGDDGR